MPPPTIPSSLRRLALVLALSLAAAGGIASVAVPEAASAAALPARGSSLTAMPAFPRPTVVMPPRSTPYVVEAGRTVDFHFAELNGSTNGHSEFQQPVLVLEPGATARNLIIGPLAADGVHCLATCRIEGMWSPHVGEDAVTLQAGSPAGSVVSITGGAVAHAYDKVVQLDGAGTAVITHLAASDIGTLARSCGDCLVQETRHVVVSDVLITGGRYKVVGVNQDRGDTARLDHVTIRGTRIPVCARTIGGRGTPAVEVPGDDGGPYRGVCDFGYDTILYQGGAMHAG
ncbi:pectate lyase [Clavibacter sp. MX14-G9D]|uniref:pectate lyase n=1 Tax=Clavibacter sp. MX14-G9D TaxID=3064656 RepID=UPI00293F58A3|nr:pectate lyase [Clavibacter sp. MX14-G9D]